MSSFQALLDRKKQEQKAKDLAVAEKRKQEEEEKRLERDAKLKKQQAAEEESKRLRLLHRKQEIEAAELAKKEAEQKAERARQTEEKRKASLKDKLMGKGAKATTPLDKIRQETSANPSGPPRKSSPHVSQQVNGSSAPKPMLTAPPTMLSREERRKLADAREFGVAPKKKSPFDRPGKKSQQEDQMSKLARITAEKAGLTAVNTTKPAPLKSGQAGPSKTEVPGGHSRSLSDSTRKSSNALSARNVSTASSRTSASSSTSKRTHSPPPATHRPHRTTVSHANDRDSRPSQRKKRSHHTAAAAESDLDSDDLDDLDTKARSRVSTSSNKRPRHQDHGHTRRSERDAPPPRRSEGGGGILASLGFDPYQSFSRSGKARSEYVIYVLVGFTRLSSDPSLLLINLSGFQIHASNSLLG